MPTHDDAAPQNESPRVAVQLAGGVYSFAMSALAKLCDFREAILDASGTSERLSTTAIVEVLETYDKLSRAVDELGAKLEVVSGWWVADQPPAFAPECISVAEAIILAAAHITACLGDTGWACFATVRNSIAKERERLALLANSGQIRIHRFITPEVTDSSEVPSRDQFAQLCLGTAEALQHYKGYDESRVGALMRCEAAAMARRAAPVPEFRSSVVACGSWSDQWGGVFRLEDVKEWAMFRVAFSNRDRDLEIASDRDYEPAATGDPQSEASATQPDTVTTEVADAPPRVGRPAAITHPRGPDALRRLVQLKSEGHFWRVIAEIMNKEYPSLTGNDWTADSVRSHHRKIAYYQKRQADQN